MARIDIHVFNDSGKLIVEGWFDPDTSEVFKQGQAWNGRNMAGVITRNERIHQCLYRTEDGRWVINNDRTQYNNGQNEYLFVDDEAAHRWLVKSEINGEAVERFFGAERAPVGRAKIGDPFPVRFPAADLAKVDAKAKRRGMSRAALIREATMGHLAEDQGEGDAGRVANTWLVNVLVKTRHGWQPVAANLAYVLASHNQIMDFIANHIDPSEVLEVGPISYASWPGLPTHIPSAPTATPELLKRLRERGYDGPVRT